VFFADMVQRLGLADMVARKARLAATGDEVGRRSSAVMRSSACCP
jgi:hypothetical protein